MCDPIQPRLLCVFPNFHKNLKLLIEYRGARLERLPIYEGGKECPNRSRSILFSTQTRIELSLPIDTKESSAGKYEIELTSAVCASIFAKFKKWVTFNNWIRLRFGLRLRIRFNKLVAFKNWLKYHFWTLLI